MFWILPISLVIIFELIADIIAKEYSIKGSWHLWLFAILTYVVVNVFFLWGLKSGAGLARGAVIFSVGSAIGAIIIGVLVYGETTNKLQLLGMVFGILSIALIFWE